MNRTETDSSSVSGMLLSVIFLNVEEYQGREIIHFYYKETQDLALLRNPGNLCGRLIPGAMINILLFPREENSSRLQEVSLLLDENDVLPEDFVPLLAVNMPAYRTSFGFISEPADNKGRYYAFFKHTGRDLLLGTGKYRIADNTGICLDFDGTWIIHSGLIENYFFNRIWHENSVTSWEHKFFKLSDTLDYLSIDDLNRKFRSYIIANGVLEFFYSDDWSPLFYRAQAKLGFIAITGNRNSSVQLLPQLQTAYALLDWKNITIDKKVKKILNSSRMNNENIRLNIDSDPDIVLENLISTWKKSSWLTPPYTDLIKKLASGKERIKDRTFRIWGVTLTVGRERTPVAGELGYTIGRTYTSLSGFFKRENKKYNNFGKLQLVLLAGVLKDAGIAFWNLGHPHMQYKTDLGAEIVPRKDFLERWDEAVEGESPDLSRGNDDYCD